MPNELVYESDSGYELAPEAWGVTTPRPMASLSVTRSTPAIWGTGNGVPGVQTWSCGGMLPSAGLGCPGRRGVGMPEPAEMGTPVLVPGWRMRRVKQVFERRTCAPTWMLVAWKAIAAGLKKNASGSSARASQALPRPIWTTPLSGESIPDEASATPPAANTETPAATAASLDHTARPIVLLALIRSAALTSPERP
jgi:hypothetical protein